MLKKTSIFLLAGLFLTGCATTPNVKLNQQFWQEHNKKTIVVVESKLPKPQLFQQGQEGLLDVLINSAVTNSFGKYLASYNLQPIVDLKQEFTDKLRAKNMQMVIADNAIDVKEMSNYQVQDAKRYATKDFRQLNGQFDADKALIISVNNLGASRSYYGFVPLGAPKAFCSLEGQLVDLQNNEILWRYNSTVIIDVAGNWDQAPSYTNFSIALDKAINTAKEELIQDFFSGTESNA